MSLGDDETTVELRALAHPVRLRILSLLTGADLTAAEIARELGLTHANASYHLRHLQAGGIIAAAGEERIRGGVAKRYRYDVEADLARPDQPIPEGAPPLPEHRLIYAALAAELKRRAAVMRRSRLNYLAEGEFWVDPDEWREIRERVADAGDDLHRIARAPRSPGAIKVNATLVLFEMEDR
jgi:DNA-binding transcriptional ArsR family regulator